MGKRTNIRDFTEGNVTGQLLSFAAPLFLSNLLQIVYNMVDMIIVGQKLGKVGLSAVSIGGDVSHFLTFLAMAFPAPDRSSSPSTSARDRRKSSPVSSARCFPSSCSAR